MKINHLIFCFSVIKKIVLLNTFIQENARMQFKCRWFNLSMMISISNSIIIALYHKDQWKQWWKKYKKCIANINAISAQRFHLFNKMIMKILSTEVFFFSFFIKCMQFMTMTLSRRCMYAKLHVIWSKLLLYIFSLINHIDSLCIQALSLNSRHRTFVFLCFFTLFAFYSFVSNSHFLIAIRVIFKYFSVAILSILMMNSVNIVSVFLSWAFFLSFICSAL